MMSVRLSQFWSCSSLQALARSTPSLHKRLGLLKVAAFSQLGSFGRASITCDMRRALGNKSFGIE